MLSDAWFATAFPVVNQVSRIIWDHMKNQKVLSGPPSDKHRGGFWWTNYNPKNKREQFNPKKCGIRDPKTWRNLRWKFTALKKVVFENLGGNRDDAALLLKMLADCHAVNALGSSIKTFGNARIKAMVICALQQFFHEYTASKGTRPA